MLIRFHTFDEASLFVAMKRADGFFAEVIHQNAGHFYGPFAVNGFAVIISEEAATEGKLVPEILPAPPSELAKVVAMFGLLGVVAGSLACIFIGGLTVLHFLMTWAAQPVKGQAIMLVSCIVVLTVFWMLLKITRIYRRPEDPLYRLSQSIIRTIAWLLIIF